MKKIIVLLVLVMFVAGLVLIANDAFAWRKSKTDEKAEVEVVEAVEEEPEAKLVYAFEDDEEMAEFEQLYVSKQAAFGRMGVLQAYFTMEQNSLIEIDRLMGEKFGFRMDPSKMYDLNRDTKEIREIATVPVPTAVAE